MEDERVAREQVGDLGDSEDRQGQTELGSELTYLLINSSQEFEADFDWKICDSV